MFILVPIELIKEAVSSVNNPLIRCVTVSGLAVYGNRLFYGICLVVRRFLYNSYPEIDA